MKEVKVVEFDIDYELEPVSLGEVTELTTGAWGMWYEAIGGYEARDS